MTDNYYVITDILIQTGRNLLVVFNIYANSI